MKEMIEIEDSACLDRALESKKAVIFKHSTRCPISAAALQQMHKYCSLCEKDVDVYYIDVIENRTLSQETVKKTGIVHQSPETIFIKNGKAEGYLTHWDISAEKVDKTMNEK